MAIFGQYGLKWGILGAFWEVPQTVFMSYFLGTYDYTIDDNFRLNIPAKFRKAMNQLQQNTFIISKAQENYLTVYPTNIWDEQIGKKILELPHSDEIANKLRVMVGINSTDTKLDSQGRITVPQEYCQHASIDKKVKIIGSVDTLQLWDPGKYDKYIARQAAQKSLTEELKAFGI